MRFGFFDLPNGFLGLEIKEALFDLGVAELLLREDLAHMKMITCEGVYSNQWRTTKYLQQKQLRSYDRIRKSDFTDGRDFKINETVNEKS